MANVLITGSTGMVGKGVLLECLDNPNIDSVTLLNRNPIELKNSKIKEILIPDFQNMETLGGKLENIDACFHCMGVSAIGLSEEEYHQLTFDITKNLTDQCFAQNPKMTFVYVSGAGTDSSEKGVQMWARVKGKTENYILDKGFGRAIMFRPGIIIPEKGIKSKVKYYNWGYIVLKPLFPLLKRLKNVTTTSKVGEAMIKSLQLESGLKSHLTNAEINNLAEK